MTRSSSFSTTGRARFETIADPDFAAIRDAQGKAA